MQYRGRWIKPDCVPIIENISNIIIISGVVSGMLCWCIYWLKLQKQRTTTFFLKKNQENYSGCLFINNYWYSPAINTREQS